MSWLDVLIDAYDGWVVGDGIDSIDVDGLGEEAVVDEDDDADVDGD